MFCFVFAVLEHGQTLNTLATRHACPHRGQGARFLLRAYYTHFCTKIIKSLERAGGAAAPQPPSISVPANYLL